MMAQESPGSDARTANNALIPVPKLEDDAYDWYARHEAVLKAGKAITPEIVLIGDSITHFWGGEPKDANPIVRGGEEWEALFGKYRTLNLGFGWDRTQNVLWRLDNGEFDGLKPKAVILNIGTNNFSQTENARASTPEETAAAVQEICRRIHEKAPEAQIILMAVFPRGEKPDNPHRQKINALNSLLKPLGEGKGIFFLDIEPQLVNADGTISKEILSDFCHPAPKGYKIWAEALKNTFKELGL